MPVRAHPLRLNGVVGRGRTLRNAGRRECPTGDRSAGPDEAALAPTGELYVGVSQGAIRATATRATGSGPAFADLGVDEDYRFALFRPDGSFSLLAERPALLESLSQVGHARDGSGRAPSERGDTARNERDSKDQGGPGDVEARADADKEGRGRQPGRCPGWRPA